MPPEQPRRGEVEQAAFILIDQPPAFHVDVPILTGNVQRRVHAPRLTFDDRLGFRQLLGRDHRTIALDDAGFLAGDLHQRIAEKFDMVDADGRDDAGERLLDHIGAVEPAAEADLQQQHIGWNFRKQQERRRGLDFKDGDRLAVIDALTGEQRVAQVVVADQRPRKADALIKPHQIGRGVDMHLQSGRLEDRAQVRDRRSLAVGAGDVDDRRQLAFGMIEPSQDARHPVEREIDLFRMQLRHPCDDVAERWLRGRARAHA